jgi:hypothetical protein
MSTDDRFRSQPPRPPPEPFPDFRLPFPPPKPVWPTVLFYLTLTVLVPVTICSGMLTVPANQPYREYFRPVNEFFAKVMMLGVGLAVGLVVGRLIGRANG